MIELMLVVAIIGILITLVTGVSTGAIRNARLKRAQVLIHVIKQGFDTYHAQYGRWPGTFGDRVLADANFDVNQNPGKNLRGIEAELDTLYQLSDEEVDSAILAMLKEAREGNPMFDASSLFVQKKGAKTGFGMDFLDAIHGTKRHPRKMSVAEMKFGYCGSDGRFKRLPVRYSPATEQIVVMASEIH